MNIYLAIITTVLVLTQVIRVVQNTISLHKQSKAINAELNRLGKVEDEDIETQKEAYRLIVSRLRYEECSKRSEQNERKY